MRIGLTAMQMTVADTALRLRAWLPIPREELEPCICSRKARCKQAQAWFTKVEIPLHS